MSRTSDKLRWHEWNPGLDNDHLTLGEVLETLPASDPGDVPWQVKLFENPESRFAFPGAISLMRHDCIHVLLGRGLRPQDEAFVIGFTMGASKRIRTWQFRLFKWASKYFYPKPWNWTRDDLIAFDLGFAKGEESGAENLEFFPFERFLDLPIAELRNRLGINTHKLYALYRLEWMMLPDKPASKRLDRDWKTLDPSDTTSPEGVDSDWRKE